MVKNAALSIRISPELKETLEKLALDAGASVAAFVERALEAHANMHEAGRERPAWILKDPEVTHGPLYGTRIKLAVATGMPVALLAPAAAEKLGQQLLDAAKIAAKLPKAR